MKNLLFIALVAAFFLNFSSFALTQSDKFDQKLYESFKNQSILLDSEKINLIRDNVRSAVSENCEFHKAADLRRIHIASVDIASQIGLNAKIDESVVPRIENSLKSIPCTAKS